MVDPSSYSKGPGANHIRELTRKDSNGGRDQIVRSEEEHEESEGGSSRDAAHRCRLCPTRRPYDRDSVPREMESSNPLRDALWPHPFRPAGPDRSGRLEKNAHSESKKVGGRWDSGSEGFDRSRASYRIRVGREHERRGLCPSGSTGKVGRTS